MPSRCQRSRMRRDLGERLDLAPTGGDEQRDRVEHRARRRRWVVEAVVGDLESAVPVAAHEGDDPGLGATADAHDRPRPPDALRQARRGQERLLGTGQVAVLQLHAAGAQVAAHLAEAVAPRAGVLDDPLELGPAALAEVEVLAEPGQGHPDVGGEPREAEPLGQLDGLVGGGTGLVEPVVPDQRLGVHGQDAGPQRSRIGADQCQRLACDQARAELGLGRAQGLRPCEEQAGPGDVRGARRQPGEVGVDQRDRRLGTARGTESVDGAADEVGLVGRVVETGRGPLVDLERLA